MHPAGTSRRLPQGRAREQCALCLCPATSTSMGTHPKIMYLSSDMAGPAILNIGRGCKICFNHPTRRIRPEERRRTRGSRSCWRLTLGGERVLCHLTFVYCLTRVMKVLKSAEGGDVDALFAFLLQPDEVSPTISSPDLFRVASLHLDPRRLEAHSKGCNAKRPGSQSSR